MNKHILRISKQILVSVIVIILASPFFGCASKGIAPVKNISDAEMAIKEAKESSATVNAPLELRYAEDKLKNAKIAFEQEEFVKAQRLADEALMDAKLAEAKSESLKAKEHAQKVRDSVETLRREIERMQKVK